jgi:hypothetical protein
VKVAGKTPTQRVEELTEQLRKLETAFETHRAITALKVQQLEVRDAEQTKAQEELRNKVAELTAKNAALEERARNQEKQSDRGFNFAQAAIISVISMIGGALLSLLAQLAIKK